jgi:hypothetical protein
MHSGNEVCGAELGIELGESATKNLGGRGQMRGLVAEGRDVGVEGGKLFGGAGGGGILWCVSERGLREDVMNMISEKEIADIPEWRGRRFASLLHVRQANCKARAMRLTSRTALDMLLLVQVLEKLRCSCCRCISD